MNCTACGKDLNPGARFCSNCGAAVIQQQYTPQPAQRLYRPLYGRMLGGVCAGFAQHFGWDVVLVRILLLVIVFFGCGTPIIAYLIAWIVMPSELFVFPPHCYAPSPPPPAPQPNGQPSV